MSTSKVEIKEAVKQGLKNFKESADAAFQDPKIGMDAHGGTTKLGTLEPSGPGAAHNMGTLRPAGGAKPKTNSDTGEEEESMQEELSTVDYINSLFEDDDLSEDFKEKLGTVFETALSDRISFIEAQMQESFNKALNEQVETLSEELSDKLDEFLSYVVEEWANENELAIQRGIQADIAESFMTGLKQLFESHYIEMPEERVNVVEELMNVKEQLEEQLNEQLDKNVSLMSEVATHRAQNIFNNLSEDLTDTEAEKFSHLIESLDYENDEQYARKLSIIKNSFLGSKTINEEVHTESEPLMESTHQTGSDPLLDAYSQAISFQNRNK